jgi:hypothetical protein
MLLKQNFPDQVNPTWSHARNGVALGVAAGAANSTVGVQFNVARVGVSCTGLRFCMGTSAVRTFKAKLYDAAGSLAATNNITTNAVAVWEVYWTTPITLTPFALYRVCLWDTGASPVYSLYTPANANAPALPFYAGGALVYKDLGINGTGDVAPTFLPGTENYPVEPILVIL